MNPIKLVFAGLLAAGLSWFTLSGYATEPVDTETDPKPSFETMDANLDGVITPTEAEGSWLAEVFADVDANEDGLVNRNEYETAIS
jgi:EF hand